MGIRAERFLEGIGASSSPDIVKDEYSARQKHKRLARLGSVPRKSVPPQFYPELVTGATRFITAVSDPLKAVIK